MNKKITIEKIYRFMVRECKRDLNFTTSSDWLDSVRMISNIYKKFNLNESELLQIFRSNKKDVGEVNIETLDEVVNETVEDDIKKFEECCNKKPSKEEVENMYLINFIGYYIYFITEWLEVEE